MVSARAPQRRDVARAHASRPRADRLGIRVHTPPQSCAFPRRSRPEAPCFYPAPHIAPRRLRCTRERRAPSGAPVRPTPHRTAAESTTSPCCHRQPSVLFKGRTLLTRAVPCRPPWMPPSPSSSLAPFLEPPNPPGTAPRTP
jgi:hypothetical protein